MKSVDFVADDIPNYAGWLKGQAETADAAVMVGRRFTVLIKQAGMSLDLY